MKILQIADSIAFELRLFVLIGVFEHDKYQFSAIASVSLSTIIIFFLLNHLLINQALFVLLMCSMAILQTITIVYLETIDQLTELVYILGIFVVTCGKLSGLILNRDKIENMMDELNGCIVDFIIFKCLAINETLLRCRTKYVAIKLDSFVPQ